MTIFPTERRAGVWTEVEGCLHIAFDLATRNNRVILLVVRTHINRSTNRLQTPLSITAWILSFVPSER